MSRIRIGFVAYPVASAAGERTQLRQLTELFREGEQLGFDSGWLRVRPLSNSVTAPIPILGAISQVTERIELGTALIPLAHVTGRAVQLASDAATLDYLTDHRLQLGVGSGIAPMRGPIDGAALTPEEVVARGHQLAQAYAKVYGQEGATTRDEVESLLHDLVSWVSGAPVAVLDEPANVQYADPADRQALRARPLSPTLRDRIWFGAGSDSSVEYAAAEEVNLLVASFDSTKDVPTEEARLIDRYARGLTGQHPHREDRRVAFVRHLIPYENARQESAFWEAVRTEFPHITSAEQLGRRWSVGRPEQVVRQLSDDPAVRRATEEFETSLIFDIPPYLSEPGWATEYLRLIVDSIAPALGWHSSASVAHA